MIGPIFSREAAVAPRRPRHFILRSVWVVALLVLMITAWMVLAGTQIVRSVGDMARFGAILFQILAPLQMALMLFLAAIGAASAVAVEKDRKTLILLLMTRLTNSELVLGKLFASLLSVIVMLLAGLPVFMAIVQFGGTSFAQVFWTFAVTAITALVAGSLGSTLALWREKTFQTLALAALVAVVWIGIAEAVAVAADRRADPLLAWIGSATSPIRAILAASSPYVSEMWLDRLLPYVGVMVALAVALNLIAIVMVRRWNPGREVRPTVAEDDEPEAEGSGDLRVEDDSAAIDSAAIDEASDPSRQTMSPIPAPDRAAVPTARPADLGRTIRTRQVWDNPVLWRELCTWAHGRKVLVIRLAYWLVVAMVAVALMGIVQEGFDATMHRGAVTIGASVRALAPLMFVSLLLINALAVTTITNERDGRALDLLMVTDITPKEFFFGKLGGVLGVTWDAILLPLGLCGYLWWSGWLDGEGLGFLVVGWATLCIFSAVLGLHCGMIYASSRQAIGVSLGTLFFLFIGIITGMVMMVSFTGSVEAQITPFLASLVGGGIGLYIALGSRNPSPAIALAAAILPLAMFFSITSFLLGRYLSVLLVVVFAYGFTTVALVMPAFGEFNIAMGRARTAENE